MYNNTAKQKSYIFFTLFSALCLGFFILFLKLGIWQLHRLQWKENLIKITNTRILQKPQIAPSKSQWGQLNEDNSAYLPVFIKGHFLDSGFIYITCTANDSLGYWQMAPFLSQNNELVFINRGFVPMDLKDSSQLRPTKEEKSTIYGILRLNENKKSIFYKNYPEQNKWYKRNLQEMAQKLQLQQYDLAPYFIDEVQNVYNKKYPLGGLTVVKFRNAHLSYALTWFCLALISALGLIYIIKQEFFNKADL